MPVALTRRCLACGYRFEPDRAICPVDGKALPPADPRVGELGSFELVERLGDGGMGAVYRAVHKRLGRVVAIKLLHRDLTNDRGLVGRFFYEARAANMIRHEHVVEVYDFVEAGEDVYFVMEYLKGEDLHDALHKHPGGDPMEPARAVAILEQIAAALHATHARNIVHRDLKPENVFLAEKNGRQDFVKVFDFGVAKLDRPDGRATVEGAVLGTPEYMAPEQASGGAIDGRADVYSLACIAYEMLTRKQIFGGGSQADILLRQITFVPPPVREHAPRVPQALDDAVLRALSKDPAKRPRTPRAFAEALARAIGRGLLAPESFRTSARPTPLATKALGPARTLSLRRERKPWRRRAALAAGAAALVVLGALLARRHEPDTSARATSVGAAAPVAATAPSPAAASSPVVAARPLVTVVLQSVPSGARVIDDRQGRLGVTPYELVLAEGGERDVRFEKEGYRTAVRQVRAHADTTIAVRLDPEPAAERARARATGVRLTADATLDPFGSQRR